MRGAEKKVLTFALIAAMVISGAMQGIKVNARDYDHVVEEESTEEVTGDNTEENSTEETIENCPEEEPEDKEQEDSEELSDDILLDDVKNDEIEDIDRVGDIAINEANFPDKVYRSYVSTVIDKDKNGFLSATEVQAVKEFNVFNDLDWQSEFQKCISIKGIEHFTNLQSLALDSMNLSNIDLSKNVNLKYLHISHCNLTTLDVSTLSNLENLWCPYNKLTSLDISKNPKLILLDCSYNQLTDLDVSNLKGSLILNCSNNKLTTLDVSKCPGLGGLSCDNNQLCELNVTQNSELMNLFCNNNKLTNLDVSHNLKIRKIYCDGNQLMHIDLSKNMQIHDTELNFGNQVTLRAETGDCQLDLKLIPGFDVTKMSNLKGGTISGTILKSPSRAVTYDYDCVYGKKMHVTLTLTDAPLKSARKFVTRMYTLCLGRTAEVNGVNYWAAQLVTKQKTGATCAYGFVFSDEYTKKNTSDDAYVKMLYEVFMDRKADSSGLKYWKDILNQGVSREYVFNGFATSTEFNQICASYDIEAGKIILKYNRDKNLNLTKYVNRIYTKAMGRKGEPNGLDYWCGQILTKKMTPVAVAEQFIYSKEFTDKKLNDTEYIKVLYRTFMGREADSAGLNYWLGQIKAGKTRKQVLKSFTGCKEFQDIIKSFGL